MKNPATEINIDVNRIERDLVKLSKFIDPNEAGHTRISFSKQDVEARAYLSRIMQDEAGLDVRIDAAGNMIGRKPGKVKNPAVLVGSHIDTVRSGGRFDGMAGVIAGLEVARGLTEKGIQLFHPLEVVAFTAEEPSPFGISTIGSRAMSGNLSSDLLESLKDSDGQTLAEALERIGGDPSRIQEARRSTADVHSYFELHIEQGPLLFSTHTPIGVVTGISGIYRKAIELIGKNDHAGTAPMKTRKDALAAASEAVLALEKICRGLNGVVGTVGKMNIHPNAANVVPGTVTIDMEVRSIDGVEAQKAISLFEKTLQTIEERRGIHISIRAGLGLAPVVFHNEIVECIRRASESLAIRYLDMPSGAGHDASHMAALAPTGMIFIPSKDGRSHCPEEWSDFESVAMGTEVLAQTVLLMDKEESL